MDNGEENGHPSHGFKKDIFVRELYLAKRGLTTVPDMSRWAQLRYLWLNNNRIKAVHGHMFNCCLAELYLQNNEIISISGALSRLTCLRVLMLHNNQMKNLEETVAELRNMQCLRILNLFLNPFTQDPEYRKYVIHHLSSVQLLDRQEVRQEERRQVFQIFCAERQQVLDTVAFSRRALIPPGRKMTRAASMPRGSPTCRKKHTKKVKGQNPSEEGERSERSE